MKHEIIIIGGGASGMMAAGTAAKRGIDVTLIEKKPVLGKKLKITGKGRCNITNYCDVENLISNIPINGKFLRNVFYKFAAYETIDFFNEFGLETKVERGKRVFPASDRSSDVVNTLKKYLNLNNVKIVHGNVTDVSNKNGNFIISFAQKKEIKSQKVILATGGKSYPATGSTGAGYKFAQKFGHTIIPLRPSLVPIETKGFEPCEQRPAFVGWSNEVDPSAFVKLRRDRSQRLKSKVSDLQGLLLKNVAIKILDKNNKRIYDDFGEMQFTEFGVSGPIILSASSYIRKLDNHKLIIDLKPALTEKQLDKRIQRDFTEDYRKQFKTVLKKLLPQKLIPVIIELSGIAADKPANQITKTERKNLLILIKNLSLSLTKFRSLKEAIITSGGVDVREINPKTMESKLVKGLFFAGEIIDVDAYTGGFNLQIAWSTGFVAGMSC